MSLLARILKRWGFVRLSDFGLTIGLDGQLVPVVAPTAEMSAHIGDGLGLTPLYVPAPGIDASRLLGDPAALLEQPTAAPERRAADPAEPGPSHAEEVQTRRPAPPPIPVRPTVSSAASDDDAASEDEEREWRERVEAARRAATADAVEPPAEATAASPEAEGIAAALPAAEPADDAASSDDDWAQPIEAARLRAEAAAMETEPAADPEDDREDDPTRASANPDVSAASETTAGARPMPAAPPPGDPDADDRVDDELTREVPTRIAIAAAPRRPTLPLRPDDDANTAVTVAAAPPADDANTAVTVAAAPPADDANTAVTMAPAPPADAVDDRDHGMDRSDEDDEWATRMAETRAREERARRAAAEVRRLSQRGHGPTVALPARVHREGPRPRRRVAAGTEPMRAARPAPVAPALAPRPDDEPSPPPATRAPSLPARTNGAPLPRLTARFGSSE